MNALLAKNMCSGISSKSKYPSDRAGQSSLLRIANDGNTGMRAAIYCRLSKDDESEGDSSSIQTQRSMLEHYCAQQGWEVVAVYQDDGFTGLNLNRPDLIRMLKAIERKQIDIVVTKDAYVKYGLKI